MTIIDAINDTAKALTNLSKVLVAVSEQTKGIPAAQIWCECFGKERQNIKKADSYEIEGILNKIGGWKRYDANGSGKTKVSLYKVQKTFVREK